MQKKISVIIPCYNVESFVGDCLESVYCQDYPNFEVILVNDGSTDKTENILMHFLKKYPLNTKYIYQENSGLSSARNAGIKESTGDYICFIDSDDLLEKNSLNIRANELDNDDTVDFIYSNAKIIYDNVTSNDTMKDKVGDTYSGLIFDKLIEKNFIIMPTVMLRKNVLSKSGLFDSDLRRVEDYDLWLRISYYGFKFKYIDEQLAYYRIRKDSLSANIEKMDATIIFVYEKLRNIFVLNKYQSDIIAKNIKSIKYFMNLRLMEISLRNNEFKLSREYMHKVFKLKKNFKNLIKLFSVYLLPKTYKSKLVCNNLEKNNKLHSKSKN